MNTAQDLENSLLPAAPHRGKEKAEQVDPKKLPSSSAPKDPRFEGSLLNMGLPSSAEAKPPEDKARNATPLSEATDKDSKALKQAGTGNEKDSKVQNSKDAGGDPQNKGQKVKSAGSNEKSSDKEKAAASKTDDNH